MKQFWHQCQQSFRYAKSSSLALLMTIVHEANGDGHAVLTVMTDKGEYILDNLNDKILLWSETPYHYYKRQSQADHNVWVLLDDTHEGAAIATSSLH